MLINQYADILNPPNGPMGGLGLVRSFEEAQGATLSDKAEYYNYLRSVGMSDEEIRAAAVNTIGPQSDADWQALTILANTLERVSLDYSPYLARLTPAQRAYATKLFKMQGQGSPAEIVEYVSNLNDYQSLAAVASYDGVYGQLDAGTDGFKTMQNLTAYYDIPIDNYGQKRLSPISLAEVKAAEDAALLAAAQDELNRAAAQRAAADAAAAAAEAARREAEAAAARAAAAERAQFEAEAKRLNELAQQEIAARAKAERDAAAAAAAAAESANMKALAEKAAAEAITKRKGNGGGEFTPMPGGEVFDKFPVAADKVDIASMTVAQKVALYRRMRDSGMTDAQIRADVESVVGKQADSDWNALRELAYPTKVVPVTPEPAGAGIGPLVLAVAAAYFLGA